MKLLSTTFFLSSIVCLASALPLWTGPVALDQVSLGDVPSLAFACPSMKIRCVKNGEWPSGIVGDIGKKDFCLVGFRCNQCEEQANTDECNASLPECEGLCQAFAPIPF